MTSLLHIKLVYYPNFSYTCYAHYTYASFMKFKNTFYSMHHTVLLSYHLVHSYPVLSN